MKKLTDKDKIELILKNQQTILSGISMLTSQLDDHVDKLDKAVEKLADDFEKTIKEQVKLRKFDHELAMGLKTKGKI